MISLAEKVNEEVETNTTYVDEAVTTANGASQKATKASEEVQKAITEANTTLQEANAAKVSAQESATASAGSASAAASSASAASGSAADAAASAKAVEDIAAGMGGFDGTATSVSATDTHNLGSTNVQGQLDALAAGLDNVDMSASSVTAVDTQGIAVNAGESSTVQALIDVIADKVMTKLLEKTAIVQTESTATNKVPSSAYLKQVKDSIDSNLEEGLREAITESDFEIVDVHTLNNYAFGSAVRCGRMVIVCFSTDSAASTPGKGTFFTLPENFRPPAIRYGMGIFANASNTDSGLTNRPVYVDISGNVCNPSSAAVYRGGGTIVYIK